MFVLFDIVAKNGVNPSFRTTFYIFKSLKIGLFVTIKVFIEILISPNIQINDNNKSIILVLKLIYMVWIKTKIQINP